MKIRAIRWNSIVATMVVAILVGAFRAVAQAPPAKGPAASDPAQTPVAVEAEPAEPGAGTAEPVAVATEPPTVEKLVERVRKSVVVITSGGRDGREQGIGTGFVVRADGWIATNFHVIGEGRPIWARLDDGRQFEVNAIQASDRALDLAILSIDAKDLVPLELGDSRTLKQGQAVVGIGNPLGLEHTVVTGVLSGARELENRRMLQLAIPIEPGNSGGPLIDLAGRAHGILTLKSAVTANLGFAVPIESLQPLLDKPNPIPMAQWLTIGALDPAEWRPVFGARWRQRAGRLMVEGAGDGFGGRSLLLAEVAEVPLPFEIAVTVKLNDEAGAAGLAFHGDGADRHYGFYPSAGELRLTRFDGPDVNSWQILGQKPSRAYRPGEWNSLRVRLEEGKALCYVNGELIHEAPLATPAGFRFGLAKFRDTKAEFKNFRHGADLSAAAPSPELQAKLADLTREIPPRGALPPALLDQVVSATGPAVDQGIEILRDRAKLLAQQSAQLEALAQAVHVRRVVAALSESLQGDEETIDLWRSALLISWLDNPELDVPSYVGELDRMAKELSARVPAEANPADKLLALDEYLFRVKGFHGSRGDYYNKSNSYVNEVLDDREGLPITLSVVYIELARRIGLRVVGVGLPGHFMTMRLPSEGEAERDEMIDVFGGGARLTREKARNLVSDLGGAEPTDAQFEGVSKRAIVIRMLHNLRETALRGRDLPNLLRYADALVAVDETSAPDRWLRAMARYQAEDKQGAREDCDWLLSRHVEDVDLDQVRELRELTERP